jgi:hypothetical protein
MLDDVSPDGGKRSLRSTDRYGMSLWPRRSPQTNEEFVRNISSALMAERGVTFAVIGVLTKSASSLFFPSLLVQCRSIGLILPYTGVHLQTLSLFVDLHCAGNLLSLAEHISLEK